MRLAYLLSIIVLRKVRPYTSQLRGLAPTLAASFGTSPIGVWDVTRGGTDLLHQLILTQRGMDYGEFKRANVWKD